MSVARNRFAAGLHARMENAAQDVAAPPWQHGEIAVKCTASEIIRSGFDPRQTP
jgi:hypothetical protein